jgi:hypothetical protein
MKRKEPDQKKSAGNAEKENHIRFGSATPPNVCFFLKNKRRSLTN